jgi:hypothetical protein
MRDLSSPARAGPLATEPPGPLGPERRKPRQGHPRRRARTSASRPPGVSPPVSPVKAPRIHCSGHQLRIPHKSASFARCVVLPPDSLKADESFSAPINAGPTPPRTPPSPRRIDRRSKSPSVALGGSAGNIGLGARLEAATKRLAEQDARANGKGRAPGHPPP